MLNIWHFFFILFIHTLFFQHIKIFSCFMCLIWQTWIEKKISNDNTKVKKITSYDFGKEEKESSLAHSLSLDRCGPMNPFLVPCYSCRQQRRLSFCMKHGPCLWNQVFVCCLSFHTHSHRLPIKIIHHPTTLSSCFFFVERKKNHFFCNEKKNEMNETTKYIIGQLILYRNE